MSAITLTLRRQTESSIDMSAVDFGRLVNMGESAIAAVEIGIDSTSAPLGDLFSVRGGDAAEIRVEGRLTNVRGLGAGLSGGSLLIAGDAGDRVGAGMTAGSIHVLGSVADDAGVGMAGGQLLIDRNAGDRLGAAEPGARRGMSGGEILVSGSVGNDAALRVRRGLIAIGGRVGDDLARDIIAGTVVAFGRVGARPGLGSKRGSIVALGPIEIPSTYRLACTYEPPFVRLLMTYLARRFGAAIGSAIATGRYRRYCGDAVPPSKGEILEWIRA